MAWKTIWKWVLFHKEIKCVGIFNVGIQHSIICDESAHHILHLISHLKRGDL